MKTNLIVFFSLLVLCAITALRTIDYQSASEPEGPSLVIQLLPEDFTGQPVTVSPQLQERTIEVLQKRFSEQARLRAEGDDKIFAVLSSNDMLVKAEKLIQRQGRLEFKESVLNEDTGEVKWITRMDGSVLKRSTALIDDRSPDGAWMIAFELTDQGKEQFGTLTTELLGKPLGIYFDGEQLSAPIIQSPITGGHGQITGGFTKEETLELATYMTSGSLPVRLKVVESRPVEE